MDRYVSRERRNLVSARVLSHFKRSYLSDERCELPYIHIHTRVQYMNTYIIYSMHHEYLQNDKRIVEYVTNLQNIQNYYNAEVYRPTYNYIYIYIYGFNIKHFKCCVQYTITMEGHSITQRWTMVSSEGSHGSKGAVAPYMERNGIKYVTYIS